MNVGDTFGERPALFGQGCALGGELVEALMVVVPAGTIARTEAAGADSVKRARSLPHGVIWAIGAFLSFSSQRRYGAFQAIPG